MHVEGCSNTSKERANSDDIQAKDRWPREAPRLDPGKNLSQDSSSVPDDIPAVAITPLLLSLTASALAFIVDLATPLGIATGLLQVVALVTTSTHPARLNTVIVAATAIAFIWVGFVFTSASLGPIWAALANRLLSTLAIIIVAWLVIRMQRSTRAKLAMSKNVARRMRQLADALPDATLEIDALGRIIFANVQVKTLLGYDPAELVGESVEILVPISERGRHRGLREGCQQPKAAARPMGSGVELFAVGKDGTEVPVDIAIGPVGDRFAASIRDDRDRREYLSRITGMNIALERSNEELEQFAYVASHDLQEPLRMVGSFVQILEYHLGDQLDDEAKRYMAYVSSGAKRLQQLIDNLLVYSRVNSDGELDTRVELDTVLDTVLESLKYTIIEAGATIEREPLPVVLGDAFQLEQLLQNLVHNAIKYRADRPPVVRIFAERDDRMWILSVCDNGIGFDMEYSDRVFRMFQRLDKRSESSGIGIGLAIVKRIAERHGGNVWVESRPGEGSKFHVSLMSI